MRNKALFLALLLLSTVSFAVVGPVNSNGFSHFVYWNSVDSSFYHVNTRGSSADTHLINIYRGYTLARDTVLNKIGGVGKIKDTTYYSGWARCLYSWRNDSTFHQDSFPYYTPSFVIKDTFVGIHVGTFGINPDSTYVNFAGLDGLSGGDFLVINGVRCRIGERGTYKNKNNENVVYYYVNTRDIPAASAPFTMNGASGSLSFTRTMSLDNSSKYSLLADPYQKNKLYFFYISDSGRVVTHASWDNGLSWGEMYDATRNPVLTDTSDHTRNNLNVSINISGVISISWTGVGITSTTISVPGASIDTVVMYVRPTGLASDDQRHLTVTNVAAFKTAMTPATAFTSIQRCIRQIIMLENGVTHTQVMTPNKLDTAMGHMRAVTSRFYNIRMLPGQYKCDWGDLAASSSHQRYLNWNTVLPNGWDKGVRIESHYSDLDSLCVVEASRNGTFYGIQPMEFIRTRGNELVRTDQASSSAPYGHWIERNYAASSYIHVVNLKFTSTIQTREEGSASGIISGSVRNVCFENNLFFSVDSQDFYTPGTRKLDAILKADSRIDNLLLVGNMFHRIYRFTGHNSSISQSSYDKTRSILAFNNTTYRFATTASLPATVNINNILAWKDTVPFVDTTIGNWPSLHKIASDVPAATGGRRVITLDSIWKKDYYGVRSVGAIHNGACVPAPQNPLDLSLSMDTVYFSGVRSVRVAFLNKASLAPSVDTVRIFRDTLILNQNPYVKADTAFSKSNFPDFYYSPNVPASTYHFTVVVGVKQDNGTVNWSGINKVTNGATILLPDLVPPRYAFTIADTNQGAFVGSDNLRFKIFSPASRGLPREFDLKKVWLFYGTDSASVVASLNDTSAAYAYYKCVDTIHFVLGHIYNDTSAEFNLTGLVENRRYFVAAVSQDSSGNLCLQDTVVNYMRSFRTKQSPHNLLKVAADTIAGVPTKLRVTISNFAALPTNNPAIDSTKVKLFVRYAGFILDPKTAINKITHRDSLIDVRNSLVSGIWTGDIDLLTPGTNVYISVSIASIDGYYSRIVLDTNTVMRRTPERIDNISPNISSVLFDAAPPVAPELLNGLNLTYQISNLNLVAERDRSTMLFKVMWDTLNDLVLDPSREVISQRRLLPADLLGNETGYKVESSGVLPGRKYFVAAFAQDTAGNWSSRLLDTVRTPANTARPLNSAWDVSTVGFDRLRVAIPSQIFTNINPATIDSNDIRGLGIWVLDTNISGFGSSLNADSLVRLGGYGLSEYHKFIFLDSLQMMELNNPSRGSLQGFLDTVIIRHNRNYQIICSPLNLFNNWGATSIDLSRFYRSILYDSSLISRPPNNCRLTVTAMKDPDSVRVTWTLPTYRYYDNAPLIKDFVDYDSVLLYYTTGAEFPSRSGLSGVTGTKVAAFKVTETQYSQTISVPGFNCMTTYRFSAYPVNGISPSAPYGNRIANDTSIAQSGPVTPPCSPANSLTISAGPDSGVAPAIRVNWEWRGGAASAPAFIRFLYRASTDDNIDPPISYADSWTREDISNPTRDTVGAVRLGRLIDYKTLYVVAVFNAGADTVWSKSSMAGMLGVLYDTVRTKANEDTTAPSNLLTLNAHALTSRSIELTWADPSNSLPGLDAAEGGNISLYYGIKSNPALPYEWRKIYDAAEFDSVRLGVGGAIKKFVLQGDRDRITANKTYYLAIAPADSAGNVDGSPAIARDSVVLNVPNPVPGSVTLKALSDTAFSINYTSLRTIADTDSFIQYAVFIISDSARPSTTLFDDPIVRQDILNGLYNYTSKSIRPSGRRSFLVRQRELASTSMDILGPSNPIKLDSCYWVSVSYQSGSELSPPLFVDSVRYKLDKPRFKTAAAVQINDSVVRVRFVPYDTTDAKIGVQIKYAVNDPSSSNAYYSFLPSLQFGEVSFSGASGGQMTLDRDSSYYIDIKTNASFQTTGKNSKYFVGNDTNTITLRFLISDLHGPIPNAADDSLTLSVRVDTKAPSPRDSTALVQFVFDPTPKRLTVFLGTKAGAVDFVRYTTGNGNWQDSVSMKSVVQDTLTFESVERCSLSFRDSLGNRFDTAWVYFETKVITVSKEPKVISYDNGLLDITITSNSIKDSVSTATDTLSILTGKRAFSAGELTSLRASGYAAVPVDAYFFLVNYMGNKTASQIWQEGLILKTWPDSLIAGDLISEARVYRYDIATGLASYVPSTMNNVGQLTVLGIKPPIASTPSTASDTAIYFVMVDTQKVVIDSLKLSFNELDKTLRLVVRGNDNSSNLNSQVMVSGHAPDGTIRQYALLNVNRTTPFVLDTVISVVDTQISAVIRRGLFAAAWITDREVSLGYRNRRAFSFVRCAFVAESLSFNLTNLAEGYQLISVPYSLPSGNDDILLSMLDFSNGRYDRNTFRLYRLMDNAGTVKEFSVMGYTADGVETDPDFRFAPNRSFFMRTKVSNVVPLRLSNPSSIAVNSNRGYLVATAQSSGWVITNVPFLGTVSVSDMQKVSSLRATGVSLGNGKTVPALGDRLFISPATNWRAVQQTSLSSGSGSLPASFAAYLYAGESLFVPVIPNVDEFTNLGSIVGKVARSEADWKVSAVLYDANGRTLDGSATIGLSPTGAAELPELPVFNDARSRLSVVSAGKQLSYDQRESGKSGYKWSFEVENGSDTDNEYKVVFEELLRNLPEGWGVVAEDPTRGTSMDIIKNGAISLVLAKGSSRSFTIVAGTESYLAKNVTLKSAPKSFALSQNFPNPFNPVTAIRVNIPEIASSKGLLKSSVQLSVYDLKGQLVNKLLDAPAEPGYRSVVWNGKDVNERAVASGIFVYRVQVRDALGKELFYKTKKMTLLK